MAAIVLPLAVPLAAAYIGGTATVLAFAADRALRRRHGLPPAEWSEAAARWFAGIFLGPAAIGFAFAVMIALDSVPPRLDVPGWVPWAGMVAITHAVTGAAFYFSLTEVRAACPRGEALLACGLAAGLWTLCLWGGLIGAVELLMGHW